MNGIVRIYSNKSGEIFRFLKDFDQNSHSVSEEDLLWQNGYENPVVMADIIGIFVENKEKYQLNMWVSLDENLYINITEHNVDDVIRYLYERYPY